VPSQRYRAKLDGGVETDLDDEESAQRLNRSRAEAGALDRSDGV
jgi:hypothetical protein